MKPWSGTDCGRVSDLTRRCRLPSEIGKEISECGYFPRLGNWGVEEKGADFARKRVRWPLQKTSNFDVGFISNPEFA